MNEAEQFVLFARQHGWPLLPQWGDSETNREQVSRSRCVPQALWLS
jgi:hypothetical protein